MSDVQLKIDGVSFEGWKSMRVTRSLDALAGSFELQASAQGAISAPLAPGRACQILLFGRPVLTGYVDTMRLSHEAESRVLSLSGRDATGDLVDCSVLHTPGQWQKTTLVALAAALVKPFGIRVVSEIEDVAVEHFVIQPEETVFGALDRAARAHAVVMTTNGQGSLVLTRTGKRSMQTELRLGNNVLSLTMQRSLKARHSVYLVRGRGNSGGRVRTELSDAAVPRYRPLVVAAQGHETVASLERRAQWERNVRRAQGTEISVTVQGWRDNTNMVYEPNMQVMVHNGIELLRALIREVEYTLSDEGARTLLSLVPPEALEAEPQATSHNKKETSLW